MVALVVLAPLPAGAETKPENIQQELTARNQTDIPQLSDIELPATDAQLLVQPPAPTEPATDLPAAATTVKEWTAQIEAATAQITAIRLVPVENRLQVELDTADGRKVQATTRVEGNALIAEIPNAVLNLPEGPSFRAEKPAINITEVTANQLNASTVQIRIVGERIAPTTEVVASDRGLVLSVAPGSEAETPVEIVVTGEREEGYRVPNTSVGTRSDTPLRDIPQSIQVVPQEVLRDRNVRSVTEAVETVSGVVNQGNNYGSPAGSRIIRGFDQGFVGGGSVTFRNGSRDVDFFGIVPIGTVERVEVLKGPASVLFGAVEPGGIINTVTKQPLSEPYYQIAFEAGNYGFYQPSIDLSGPLTADKTVLYRFVAAYQGSNSIQPFVDQKLTTIAPSITFNLGDRTKLNLYYEYTNFFADDIQTDTVILSDGSLAPRDFYLGYPNLNLFDITNQRFGYTLTHKFSDNLQLRNNLAISLGDHRDERGYAIGVVDDRFIQIESLDYDYTKDNYFGSIDLLGEFKTGSISHQLLVGFDVNRYVENATTLKNPDIPDLDILNPNYDFSSPGTVPDSKYKTSIQSYGVYLQDRIALGDRFKLLVGGRYDWVSYENEIADFGPFGNTTDDPVQNNGAFSPRIGLVYQPSDTVSLYASYSRSFVQTTGFNPDGRAFKPTRGTQYEVGVKADFLDGKLSTTLAGYQITKTNVTTEDPVNPEFFIQTGKQRSRGIELDIAGEILPGWKIIASYAYTNAKVTEDNVIPVGNRLNNVPENQASLWTTYEIQSGNLKGLGFGLGLFYVGERQGDLANSFQVDGYLRTDAALYYRRDGLNAAINIRNLFDNDYVLSAFGAFSAQRDIPFTITGSISWQF
ncbi:MAG: TonB-dependent siderophore receptor [Cyanosarcina radialis HA8281-LM2]|jgi:iron complex outermembrane receptor protein|nr:TonB-dependent siderophore receptor [Cyanosarcina radialis HA8281-LM2]